MYVQDQACARTCKKVATMASTVSGRQMRGDPKVVVTAVYSQSVTMGTHRGRITTAVSSLQPTPPPLSAALNPSP